MIAYVRGRVLTTTVETVIVDIGGIGYEIYCSKGAFEKAVVYAAANRSFYSYIIKERVSVGDDCGAMSLFLPKSDSRYRVLNADFAALEWYRAVGWDEAGW